MARQVAAGTVAELGDRVCAMLDEAARAGAGIGYALLADGMTACWDSLQQHLGPADELVRGLLAMRGAGLAPLARYPYSRRELGEAYLEAGLVGRGGRAA